MAKTKRAENKIVTNQIMFDFETNEVEVVRKDNNKTKSIKHNHIKKHRKVKKILKGVILNVNRRNQKRYSSSNER